MMSMDNSIKLVNLNEELSRLWNTEQGQKKTRASLFNLIMYVQKSEHSGYYQSLIKSVVSRFPCRVMMILADTDPTQEYLKTTVNSETLGKGESQVYCEIIQIEVAGSLCERVPFIILPHILPDLPVYLLWTQDPTSENTVLPHIEPFADRIIFDSEFTNNLQLYSQSVLALMQRFHCAIGDLNWSALSGWRSIFAQVFSTQESILTLAQSKMIRIHYNQHSEIRAAYLQAWLSARMSWQFDSLEVSEGNIRLTYRRPLHEVVFILSPEEVETLPAGAIVSVEIESIRNKGDYIFKRHPHTRQILIQYSEKDLCHLPYSAHLAGNRAGQEILEEIFYPSGGKHYHDMLTVLAEIPWRKA